MPLNGPGRVAQVQRMTANTGAKRVYFWSQEMDIARQTRALGLDRLDGAGLAHIVGECALLLIGPEMPAYLALIAEVARKWLKEVDDTP